MAVVLALKRGWDAQSDAKFKVIGKFKSLRDAVNADPEDESFCHAFMWEKFTTKPFHDTGEVRKIGSIVTPWPCFMMAALKTTLDDVNKCNEIRKVIAAVNEAAAIFRREREEMPATIAKHYSLSEADAKEWYSTVDIVAHKEVSAQALQTALDTLCDAGELPTETKTAVTVDSLVDSRLAVLTDVPEQPISYQLSRRLLTAGVGLAMLFFSSF